MSNSVDLMNVQEVVSQSIAPPSFGGDWLLMAANLGMMTAFAGLGVMAVGWLATAMIVHRKPDPLRSPVTIFRAMFLCAAIALTLRSGAEAASLWAWDGNATALAQKVQKVKRYVDLVALAFAGGWLVLLSLSYPSMIAQLRKRPFPVHMLARLPALKRPAVVVAMCFVAAIMVTWLRFGGVR